MNKSEQVKLLQWVKKIKALKYINQEECKCCGEKDPIKLCFHHKCDSLKEYKVSQKMDLNFDRIKKEIVKCDVYCQNCHQEYHTTDDILESSKFKKNNKKMFMLFIDKCCCEKCGYDKCLDSLNFHHKDPDKKTIDFRIFRKKINNISDILEYIKTELNNCEVICRNCHILEHTDIEFFNKHKDLIYEKAKTFKGNQSKLPVDKILDMYQNGMKQIEISKIFNTSKGTISGIIKKHFTKK